MAYKINKVEEKTFLHSHSQTEPRLPANAMPGRAGRLNDYECNQVLFHFFSLCRASATPSTRTAIHTRIIALLHAPSYKQHTGPVSLDRGALISLTS